MNKLTIKSFFKNIKTKDWKKEYLINVNDTVDVYFNLIITIRLYAWSNDKQKYVPLKKSIYGETKSKKEKYISSIKKHYKPIIKKIFIGLYDYLKDYCYLKEFIHTIENPLVKYHYKLLNTFTKEELDKIRATFRNIPVLNICEFHQKDEVEFPYILEVDYIDGFYTGSIEVKVDLDNSDYAGIYKLSNDYNEWKKTSKEKALKRLLDE
jgi:hypothetical protein